MPLLPGEIQIKGSRRLVAKTLKAYGVAHVRELPDHALKECLVLREHEEVVKRAPGRAKELLERMSVSHPVVMYGHHFHDVPAFLPELVRRGIDLSTLTMSAQLKDLAKVSARPRGYPFRKMALTLRWSHLQDDSTPDMCTGWAAPFNGRHSAFLIGAWQHILSGSKPDHTPSISNHLHWLGFEPRSFNFYVRADLSFPDFVEFTRTNSPSAS